jgi:hypothetical protein
MRADIDRQSSIRKSTPRSLKDFEPASLLTHCRPEGVQVSSRIESLNDFATPTA